MEKILASTVSCHFSQTILAPCISAYSSTAQLVSKIFPACIPPIAPITVGLYTTLLAISVLSPSSKYFRLFGIKCFSTEELKAKGMHELANKQEKTETAVRNFLEINGCKYAAKINVCLTDSNIPYHEASIGFNRSWGGPLIILNSGKNYLDNNGSLTPLAQASIAHEFAHIDKKHSLWILAMEVMTTIISTGIASLCVRSILRANPILGTISFVFLTFLSNFALKRITPFLRIAQERSADAAIGTFIKNPRDALCAVQANKRDFQQCCEENKQTKMVCNILSSLSFKYKLDSLKISELGNNRLDFFHPPLTQRVAFFEKEEQRLQALVPPLNWYQTIRNRIGKLQLGW